MGFNPANALLLFLNLRFSKFFLDFRKLKLCFIGRKSSFGVTVF